MAAMEIIENDTKLFRLDSCADTHVCNDHARFTTFKPIRHDIIRAGDTFTTISGTGTVHITVRGPKGPKTVKLLDVAYCPGFHLNLVSYIRLKASGVRWNDEIGWLKFKGKKYAQTIEA